MNYIEYDFTVSPTEMGAEILMAELAEVGFDSFEDTPTGIKAYIPKDSWNEHILQDIYLLSNPEFTISYQITEIEQVNWNEEWEKNFSPIVVEDLCTVRANFHPVPNTRYDIVITPKMSFGTGHHETTYMMLQQLLPLSLEGTKVLDMGCGTGILAIMAALRGARDITAIDIDPWCVENATENVQQNDCSFITIKEGDVSLIAGEQYNLILANINRNILLSDIPAYTQALLPQGLLLVSGFYVEDLPAIKEKCQEVGLTYLSHIERNRWVSAKFQRLS
ncbi:ribosomal protein L11 methyltransferase [Capnocytophaga granulosa]|uniref:Ribosomal protein L11 methyltransferase n=1 Tax=Capnocytophaga granulosa TaxID=45242 RepID=A0A1H2QBG1_9FLAO|nr:50S ribosomal protein L11 methyltransferase [Capnocytophaga granulosa]EPD29690.1 ribosomal protein L11 methyltransferase [Capnocytophaga granulosa ATCC 51502]SDW04496.1 ribosomal protein L11 methyltransferase [Capnocytophaga granulosa]SUX22393.1 Ribosomal protein L11 methyltransferase [Capnocytophaga granulosa]